MLVCLEWLQAEARVQGLTLTPEDLKAIQEHLEKNKTALIDSRPTMTEGLEPAYRFVAEGPTGSV